jgi:class 3 adenylate cyclase
MKRDEFGTVLIFFLAFWACYAAESLCVLLGRRGQRAQRSQILYSLRLGYLGFALLLYGILHWAAKRASFRVISAFNIVVPLAVYMGLVCSCVSNILSAPTSSAEEQYWNMFEALFFVMVISLICRILLQTIMPIVLFTILVPAVVAFCFFAKHMNGTLLFHLIIYSTLLAGSQFVAMHSDPRRSHIHHKAVYAEHERVNQLLDSMLPPEVLAEMKSGTLSLAYQYEDMTFLFADICGFTKFCAERSAEQAVNLVTNLFAAFDDLTEDLQVYKVCTIGDAYVVVNEPRRQRILDKYEDCSRVLLMAQGMLKIIRRVRHEIQHLGLDMRIGLHCGRFVGGVVGTKRVRFDMWGEDVLIANSIESNGVPGRICASEQAKETLEIALEQADEQASFTFHKDFEFNPTNTVRTYLVEEVEASSGFPSEEEHAQ